MNDQNPTEELFKLVDKQKYTVEDLKKIKTLLSEGADPNFRQDDYPYETVLCRVISSWDDKKIEIINSFLEYNVDFNLPSDIFYPIYLAATKDDVALVQFMLDNGTTEGLDSALKAAIERDNIELATLLLSYDVHTYGVEPYAQSFLTCCCETYRLRDRSKQYEIQPGIAMAKLLIDTGIDPNGIDKDASPLLEAIRHNFYDLIDLLLDTDGVIKTGISASSSVHTVETFQYLIQKGIITDLNEVTHTRKQSPLVFYSMNGYIDLVKYLIENGADLYHTDSTKKTAFHYALYGDDSEYIDYLLNHYDVTKCQEISSVLDGVDNKKTIKKINALLNKAI